MYAVHTLKISEKETTRKQATIKSNMSLWSPPPLVNDTNPCSGVDAIYEDRPMASYGYYWLNAGMVLVSAILLLGSLPLAYYYRDSPRLRRVRPFVVTFFGAIFGFLFICICLLPEILAGFPCVLMLYLFTFSHAVSVIIVGTRTLLFAVESQIAHVLSQDGRMVSNGNDDISTIPDSVGGNDSIRFREVFITTLKIGFGGRPIENLSVPLLVALRKYSIWVLLLISILSFLVSTGTMAGVPVFHNQCKNCEIYMEWFITIGVVSGLYLQIIINFIIQGRKFSSRDQQGIFSEIIAIVAICPFGVLLGYILTLIDPGRLSYDRIFSWRIFSVVSIILYWFFSSGYQVFVAIRTEFQRNSRLSRVAIRNRGQSNDHMKFMDLLQTDEELRARFVNFTTTRFVSENFNFLEDVRAYKRYYDQKADSWKKIKAEKLIKSYISHGAPQEVNISSVLREKILGKEVTVDSQLYTIFDEAYREILFLTASGTWSDFLHHERATATQILPIVN